MVRPLWFMSDMVEQYYLAWVSVFDGTPRKLLCTWHVDRVWWGALQQHVTGVEKQPAVYSKLRVLLEETDKAKLHLIDLCIRTVNHARTYVYKLNKQQTPL